MLGLIGTGLMGVPLAETIIAEGKKLNLFNRTQSKLKDLENKGAKVYKDIPEFFKNSDGVLLML